MSVTGFAIPRDEADARFSRRRLRSSPGLTSEQRFSHHGRFWTSTTSWSTADQAKAAPAVLDGRRQPSSIRRVAERGHHLLLDQSRRST